MARIRLYNNAFENKYDEFELDSGCKILDSIEKRLNKKIYTETLVECYDTETGKTFYAPIEDSESNSIIISVNGVSVDKDYEPKENDIINVIYMPAGGGGQNSTLGAIFGTLGGIIAGVAFVTSLAMSFGATAPLGVILFAGFVGGVLGGIAGYSIGQAIDNAYNKSGSKSQKGLKEGKQSPDVRGAENTSLRGNNYPFVMGKHLITPFIVGDPYTEYTGNRGENAYVRVLLCAGYAPLKLTDFKLGEFMLAYNRSHGSVTCDTMISGLLKGYSTTPGIADNGDILDLWKNNDIELEIIQQAPDYDVDPGTIYPEAVDEQQIDANILFIADKELDDAALVTYKGVSFPNHFRTNGVFFTDSCPLEFTVNLDFPNGIYSSYTKTEDNVSEAIYGDIPLWLCVQWRPYNKNNASSDPTGRDYSSWHNINFGYTETFSVEEAKKDVIAHKGNDFSSYYLSEVVEKKWVSKTRYNSEYNEYERYSVQEDVVTQAEMTNLEDLYDLFIGKDLQNFQPLSGGEEGMSQTRVSATVHVPRSVCYDLISPNNPTKSIEIRVIRVSPGYINMTHNVDDNTSAYNYSDLVKVTSVVTKSFDEDDLRLRDLLRPVTPQSDADYKKFCYIALKAKADASGYIINQLNKINCVAESFSPYWNMTTKQLLPIGVNKVTTYYGYYQGNVFTDEHRCNRSTASGVREIVVTKAQYEKARHDGFNWYEDKNGSNYKEVMDAIVFQNRTTHNDQDCYFLNATAAQYNNNCVSSGFLLGAVGPQAGSEACGYEDLNILSIADWAETTDALTDGSTFNSDTTYRGVNYNAGDLIPLHYEANAYLYQGIKFEDFLSKIAAAGRAIWIIDETGKIKVIMDKPVDYYKGAISLQDCISSSNTFSYEKLPAGLLIQFSDENDGFETNSIYCWSDGNSIRNYHGVIEPYGVDYVTNPYQLNSLGCYMLACRVASKEMLTRKIGVNGELYSVGDVLLVQSDDLLIGETSGRIQELIEADGVIYGFVVDSEYDYTAELDSSGNSTQGVTIIQPGYLGKSRAVTLPLADPHSISIDEVVHEGGETTVITHTYELKKGRTNVVLIGKINGSQTYGVRRTSADHSATLTDKYDFKIQDVVLFGLIDKIAAPYRITKIKPDKGGQFTETLIPYDENFYNYGKELPSFQNYITPPAVTESPIPLVETPSKISDQNNQRSEVLKEVGFLKDSTPPSVPLDVTAVATRDRISFSWGVYDPEKVKHTVIEYSADGGLTWSVAATTASRSWEYFFNRGTDGYPEASTVASRRYRLKNVSIFNVDSNYTETVTPSTLTYGTWQPDQPSFVSKKPKENTIEFNWNDYQGSGGKSLYGTNHFEFKIKYNGTVRKTIITDETSFIYSFDRDVDRYPEATADETHPGLNLYTFDLKVFNESTKYAEITNQTFSQVEMQDYGTWIVPQVTVNKEVVDRTIILTAVYGGSRKVYGKITTLARIKRIGNLDISGERSFNDLLAITPDEDYYTPEYDLSVQTSTTQDNEPHYRKYGEGDDKPFVSVSNKISHTLPLIGQTARVFKNGMLILENGVCIEDIPDAVSVPENPSEGDMIHLTGIAEGFVTGGYYLYSNSEWSRKFSKFTKDVQDYSSFPQSPTTGTVIHYIGRDPDYVEGGYYLYDGFDWILVQGKYLIVPTTYYYEISMSNESGSTSNVVETEVTALSTNISDIVHTHEHYKELYVEKLSAINANLGMISQGGMGNFDETKGNYWALSDLSAEDSGIAGGIKKGAFRVGGEDQYFKVTPAPNDPEKFKIELRAGSINLTTDSDKDGFVDGTYIYEGAPETAVNRLALTSIGIIAQTKVNNIWNNIGKVIIDSKGNMIITNSDKSVDFGFQVTGTIYHFDDPNNPTHEEVGEGSSATNPEDITCVGSVVNTEDKQPILLAASSPKCFNGNITKDVSQFTGTIVLFSKSDSLEISDSIINKNGTIDNGAYTNNTLMTSAKSGYDNIGTYLGLSSTQINSRIFKNY